MNKKMIGFVMIILSLSLMGVWEFWGREELAYEDILVLREPLEAGTILEEDSFSVKKVDSPSKEALKPPDKTELIGLVTSQYVADNLELRREYFVHAQYQVGDDIGKGIMALSMDWLLSYPQTMRRGDNIAIYKDSTKLGECIVAHVRDSANNEVIFSSGDRISSSGTVLYVEVIGDISTLIGISKEANKGERFSLINME